MAEHYQIRNPPHRSSCGPTRARRIHLGNSPCKTQFNFGAHQDFNDLPRLVFLTRPSSKVKFTPCPINTVLFLHYQNKRMSRVLRDLEATAAMTRISWRRYTVQLLWSLCAVILPYHICQNGEDIIQLLGTASLCSSLSMFASDFLQQYSSASPAYCGTVTFLLVLLHRASSLLGRYIAGESGFTTSQHVAVHLALGFYILSELEFYRNCIVTYPFDNWRMLLLYCIHAQISPTFTESRDLWWYTPGLHDRYARYLNSDTEPGGFTALRSKSNRTVYMLMPLFFVINGCLNYGIKRMVNPSHDSENFLRLVGSVNVLFRVDSTTKLYLGVGLLRVARQTNFLAFWTAIRGMERSIAWYKAVVQAEKRKRIAQLFKRSDKKIEELLNGEQYC
ncbi:Nn.00g043880.m01.CDS01 [Neocucurbitaria sp. VM-36]